jgi:UDP-3-O-[3-hydroxymyristoyl] N-acetylglucosamine deacetylase
MQLQKTLARKVICEGIGIHRGEPVKVIIYPAAANSGIRFIRTDLPGRPVIPARFTRIVSNVLATTLGVAGATISTVEHLLAALSGLGIDNARVEVHGPELPILDGSAAPYVALFRKAGIRALRLPRSYFWIQKSIEVVEGDKKISVEPASEPCFSYLIDFAHPCIGQQEFNFYRRRKNFCQDIAPARTFGFLQDVEKLQANGLALGGSMDNAVVLSSSEILNPDGLRFPDEFVRHKILDLIGDLTLLGWPILGHLKVTKGSHALHHRFMETLLSQHQAWRMWNPEFQPSRLQHIGMVGPYQPTVGLA